MSRAAHATGHLAPPGRPRLFFRWRAPASAPRATVVVVHGFGEHGGRYEHVLAWLAAHGVAGLAIDYRGFGRAEGRRAFVARFDDYLDDVDSAIDEATRRAPTAPVVLLGHSMGGLIAARSVTERPGRVHALALSGPALRFAMPIPAWKRCAARALNRVWPTFASGAGIDPQRLTHDAQVLDALRSDPLCVRTATVRWYTESRAAQRATVATPDRVTLPLLVLLGADDRIVDTRLVTDWAARCATADRTTHVYPGMFHEVLNEPGHDRVLADLTAWLGRVHGA